MAKPFSPFDEPRPFHRLWRSRPTYTPVFSTIRATLLLATAVSQLNQLRKSAEHLRTIAGFEERPAPRAI
jgi:hypothetical protein